MSIERNRWQKSVVTLSFSHTGMTFRNGDIMEMGVPTWGVIQSWATG